MGKIANRPNENGVSAERITSLFAHPGNERDIFRAWENFLSGVSMVGPPVRVMVERSWKRSAQSGVNAREARSPVVVVEEAFQRLRKRNRLLSASAAATIAENAALLNGTRSMLILTDPGGVILDIAGDPRTIDSGQDINLIMGGNWNECVVGTNAIGTAIAAGQAVQVHAAEHFCEGVKKWTCAAAPIHDPRDRTLLGVLDISGPDMSFCQHNLALALSAAKQIEATLVEKLFAERTRLLEACLSVSPRDSASMVVLDYSGCVVYVNDEAAEKINSGSLSPDLRLGKRVGEPGSILTLEELQQRLPPDMRSEWLHPLKSHNDTLGTLLVIPEKPQHPIHKLPQKQAKEIQDDNSAKGDRFAAIVGASESIETSITRARRLARSLAPVLIEGETGVGKELFAQAIQSVGPASNGPYVTYNCGAVSKELIGSELFGYVKGAFTGASSEGRVGRFELADGGTLCLDEIGEMPVDLQPYLLRVLEEGIVYRLGENKPRKVNVRLLALTNRNLREEVTAGRFRQDLFYRISVTSLVIPPLRERSQDVALLIEHFNQQLAAQHNLPPVIFEPQALDLLARYHWPGNVRELRNVVESLLLMGGDKSIELADLPEELRASGEEKPTSASSPELKGLEATERDAIEAAIKASNGNLSRAARQLGISRSTLYRKIEHYSVT